MFQRRVLPIMVFFTLVTGLWPRPVLASFLRMTPEFHLKVSPSRRGLSIDASITNQGDETARDIQIEEIEGHAHSARVDSLNSGGVTVFHLESPWVKSAVYGRFPVLFLVHYRDLNGYSFSAPYVSVVTVDPKTPVLFSTAPQAEWQGKDVSLGLTGDAEATLKVKGPVGIRYHARSFSAEEISSRALQTDFVLDAAGEAPVEFRFKNISAISNSTYPVYAVLTAERGNGESMVTVSALDVHVTQDSQMATGVLVFGFFALLLSLGRRIFHRV